MSATEGALAHPSGTNPSRSQRSLGLRVGPYAGTAADPPAKRRRSGYLATVQLLVTCLLLFGITFSLLSVAILRRVHAARCLILSETFAGRRGYLN